MKNINTCIYRNKKYIKYMRNKMIKKYVFSLTSYIYWGKKSWCLLLFIREVRDLKMSHAHYYYWLLLLYILYALSPRNFKNCFFYFLSPHLHFTCMHNNKGMKSIVTTTINKGIEKHENHKDHFLLVFLNSLDVWNMIASFVNGSKDREWILNFISINRLDLWS